MDIETVNLENVKELFNISNKIHNFKSMKLNKIQCKQVYDFVLSQQAEIERLKAENSLLINCENCRHEPDDSNSECYLCCDCSRWQSNYLALDY